MQTSATDAKHEPHDWLVSGLIVQDGGGNLQNAQDFSPSLRFWLFFLFYRQWLTQCVVLGFKPRTTWRHTSPFTQWAVQTKPWCGLSLICCWLGLSPLAWPYLRYAHAHTLGFYRALIGWATVRRDHPRLLLFSLPYPLTSITWSFGPLKALRLTYWQARAPSNTVYLGRAVKCYRENRPSIRTPHPPRRNTHSHGSIPETPAVVHLLSPTKKEKNTVREG